MGPGTAMSGRPSAPASDAVRWAPLRMQSVRPMIDGVKRPNRSLADFIAPRGAQPDYIGLFAVTAGVGADKKATQFEAAHDDYSQVEKPLTIGSMVVHPTFGKGKVEGVIGNGDKLKITVRFEKVGRKQLMMKFANLRLL